MDTLILAAAPIRDKGVEDLKKQYKELVDQGTTPCLRIILVGNNPASEVYTKNKKRFAEKLGADCEIIKLPEDLDERSFLKQVNSVCDNNKVHGVLIQLPLPKQLGHLHVEKLIPANKDVDGFHATNVQMIYQGNKGKEILAPCTPKGVMDLFNFYNLEVSGKDVVIIGRSKIVGRPLALMMLNYNATVTICHSQTKDLKHYTKNADIIVTAIGQERFLTNEYIGTNKPVVIDVGINRGKDGKLYGDCDFENIKDSCSAITPVPGGVGPLTIFNLAKNLLIAAKGI